MVIIIKSAVQQLLKDVTRRRMIHKEIKQILNYTEYSKWDLGVFFVGDKEIKELNLRYRNINKATDVLSFPLHQTIIPGKLPNPLTPEHQNLGDMIISVPYVMRWCKEHDEIVEKRLPVLYTHGICHLIGYDHENEEDFEEMNKKEREILDKFWDWKKRGDDCNGSKSEIESDESDDDGNS
ncbi:7341_t:CDS:2 [Funneliformis geosporum]|uniref:11333_t:CDS:1 n=1 Tax=Funneliformis geosporum TaxID=1117311 RepID=A0A9W4WUH6_9GLOM|nr:7341_t:CDS:2 [Funneliformis geosporum]CAI2164525.1 11333_t:CDS:2 [Funneliformis geosporum]